MTTMKKYLGAAAFTLVLAGGGAAGALLGTPGSAGAHESTASTDGARHHRLGGPLVAAAAEALGMTAEEFEAGATVADVAGEKGIDADAVVDAMVAAVTEDVRDHITAIVNGEAPLRGHGHGRHGGRHAGFRVGVEAAADTLGLTPEELRVELSDGSTLAEVASEHGVDRQAVVDAMVAAISAHLDERVAAGELTEEEADERKADLTDRIAELVTNGRPERASSSRP